MVFYFVEKRTASPLMQVSIFRIRAFRVENIVLGVAMLAFIPVFFFASVYAQVALAKPAHRRASTCCISSSGSSSRRRSAGGCWTGPGPSGRSCWAALAAVGFWLWAGKATDLNFGAQQWYVIVAGAGMGFMLGPASTDAVNQASRLSYGEATGITQTVRNYAASLGLAILGTLLVSQLRSHVTTSLQALGVPPARAAVEAQQVAPFPHSSTSTSTGSIPHFIRLDFADATQAVFYAMAIFMAVAAIVALIGLRWGVQEATGGEAGHGRPVPGRGGRGHGAGRPPEA